MLRELNSRQFVLFLETLTGIESLMPDPYYIGGGVHISGQGDFLKIHCRLQLAPQAPGLPARECPALLHRCLAAGMERCHRVLGQGDDPAGGERATHLQPHRRVLDGGARSTRTTGRGCRTLTHRTPTARCSTCTTTRPLVTTATSTTRTSRSTSPGRRPSPWNSATPTVVPLRTEPVHRPRGRRGHRVGDLAGLVPPGVTGRRVAVDDAVEHLRR